MGSIFNNNFLKNWKSRLSKKKFKKIWRSEVFFSFSDIHVIGDVKVFKDAIEEEQDDNMTMKEWRVESGYNN